MTNAAVEQQCNSQICPVLFYTYWCPLLCLTYLQPIYLPYCGVKPIYFDIKLYRNIWKSVYECSLWRGQITTYLSWIMGMGRPIRTQNSPHYFPLHVCPWWNVQFKWSQWTFYWTNCNYVCSGSDCASWSSSTTFLLLSSSWLFNKASTEQISLSQFN